MNVSAFASSGGGATSSSTRMWCPELAPALRRPLWLEDEPSFSGGAGVVGSEPVDWEEDWEEAGCEAEGEFVWDEEEGVPAL